MSAPGVPGAAGPRPAGVDKHPARIAGMFDRIAPVYDVMNRVMTAGLDQRWRRLAVSLVVWPGQIAFSASSPWNELSGMTELTMAEDEARPLWITFIPDPGEPGNWVMMF